MTTERETRQGLARVIEAYRDGVTILDRVGEHDMANADELEAAILAQAQKKRQVVVSLRDADFIDSSIIATMFRGYQAVIASGGRLVLHSDCEAGLKRVLDISRLRDEIPCAETLDEAIDLARSPTTS